MDQITRDPLDLVAQTISSTHQYPDGALLFLGTLFAQSKTATPLERASHTSWATS
jgi:fumarylacetoacetate (FAA) hydrolase family protein